MLASHSFCAPLQIRGQKSSQSHQDPFDVVSYWQLFWGGQGHRMAGNNDVCLHNALPLAEVVSVPWKPHDSSPCSSFITCHLSQHVSCTQDVWTQICTSFKFCCFTYHPLLTWLSLSGLSSLCKWLQVWFPTYIPAGHLNIDLPEHHSIKAKCLLLLSFIIYYHILGVNGINGLSLNPVVLSIHFTINLQSISSFSSPFVLPFSLPFTQIRLFNN